MARIRIEDLPVEEELPKDEAETLSGGLLPSFHRPFVAATSYYRSQTYQTAGEAVLESRSSRSGLNFLKDAIVIDPGS